MRTPTFLEGALVALAASLIGSVLHTAMTFLGLTGAPWLLVGSLGLGYALYLLWRSPVRFGRVAALAAWGAGAGLLGLAAPSLALYVGLQVAALWLLRSLFFHARPVAALADLVLSGGALAAGLWALAHTGSLLLGLWCFFLVQALFVLIPQGSAPRRVAGTLAAEDRFETAHRVAEAAVRRLVTPR